jgi:alpha-glucosidase
MKNKFLLILLLHLFCIKVTAQSTASKQVTTFIIEAPQLNTQKKIWVYLPKDYQNSKKSYSVIYMHDAQNLFDAVTSYVGEWEIDEYLDSIDANESLIIGIEHGNEKRIDEFTPYVNEKYGGGKGNEYLSFIINTLKPYIDLNFKTQTNNLNTTIWGSSLGGLISLFAIIKYPKTFSKAGIFSPAFWINNNELFEFVKKSEIDPNAKFFFLIGSQEGETLKSASNMVSDQHEMVQLLLDKGIIDKNIIDKVIPDGHHNQILWSTNFAEAYQWLIKN